MTALPASAAFTAATVTEADFKAAQTALRDFLAGLLGADGTAATALATLGALASAYLAKSAAYTVTTADRGRVIDATTGTWTLALPTAASAGSGFSVALRNSGSGVITIDPASAETIGGGSTLRIAPRHGVVLVCTGSAWIALGLGGDEAVSLPSGSSGAPGLTFIDDPDTGLLRPGSNQLGFSLGGTQRGLMTTSALDFVNLLRNGSQVFSRDNILGTVSQASGVPTGAVIERGSNANGDYVRWADGTQICMSGALASGNVDVALGSIFQSVTINWTFPAAFLAATYPVLAGSGGGAGRWISSAISGPTTGAFRVNSPVTSTSSSDARLIAVGRWF